MSESTLVTREQAYRCWLRQTLGSTPEGIEPVSGDASFRRYFRVRHASRTLILMDAPPQHEDCAPFVAIARHWRAHGIEVPALVALDLQQGFLLLEDQGDTLLLHALRDATGQPSLDAAHRWYPPALRRLRAIQSVAPDPEWPLPPYDHALLEREMTLFRDWLVGRHLGLTLDPASERLFADTFEALAQAALEQPVVPVHRDYHSRNLMCLPEQRLGILDFQDAVMGPLTYDLVSLLRDCYIVWPEPAVRQWVDSFYQLAHADGLTLPGRAEFQRWFDLMGVQRHLKAAGIFARLSIRDDKHGYLASIPDTVGYLRRIMPRHAQTQALGQWIETHLVTPLQLERAPT